MKPRPSRNPAPCANGLTRPPAARSPSALFAGGRHDAANADRLAARCQLRVAAFAFDRHAGDAELGRLLQDPVIFSPQRACNRVIRSGDSLPDTARDRSARASRAGVDDAGVVVIGKIAVEQHAGVADLEARITRSRCCPILGSHSLPTRYYGVDVAAGQAHAGGLDDHRLAGDPRRAVAVSVVDAVRRHPVQDVAERAQHHASIEREAR